MRSRMGGERLRGNQGGAMDQQALERLLQDIKNERGYDLQDLFKIRDALIVLQGYGLADLDLLIEVMKYINQKGENNS